MTTVQEHPPVTDIVHIAGDRVELIDEAGDVARRMYPDEALALSDALNAARDGIAALARRKAWVEKVAQTVATVTRYADVPHSVIFDRDGTTVSLGEADHVMAIADAFNEPVSATYDASWDSYESLADRVTFTVVVAGDVTYKATDRDADLADALRDREPVSA